jgi:Ca-activated chloride channel family protein
LVVDYHLAGHAADTATPPDLYVIGPGDFRKPLDVVRVSPNTWRGRLRIGATEGLFRIRSVNESRSFPEVGLYRQESELSDYGSNDALLKSVAQSTGGRFNPSTKQLFDSGGKYIESTLRLWPGLLAIALLLNLIELVMRKWRGILESFRGSRQTDMRIAA